MSSENTESIDLNDIVLSDLYMISFLCGYRYGDMPPTVRELPEVVKRCISIGKHGWGLALFAITTTLSGFTTPQFLMQLIPFGYLDRVEDIRYVPPEWLVEIKAVEDEGFFLSKENMGADIGSEHYSVELPVAFAIVIKYRDREGNPNWRVVIIQHTQYNNNPWIAVIPSDNVIKELVKRVKSSTYPVLPPPDGFYIKHGVKKPPEEVKEGEEAELPEPEEILEGGELPDGEGGE